MARIPEFIGVMKFIRDDVYPIAQAVYDNMVGWNNIYINSVTTVPNNQDGSAGPATVTYDNSTGAMDYGIPQGKRGESMKITHSVADEATRLALVGLKLSDYVFQEDTSEAYIPIEQDTAGYTITWSNPINLSTTATSWTDLDDTPSIINNPTDNGKLVSADSGSLILKTEADAIPFTYAKANSNEARVVALETNDASQDTSITQIQTDLTTKIRADNYATATVGGTIKIKVVGGDLYITTDGSDA